MAIPSLSQQKSLIKPSTSGQGNVDVLSALALQIIMSPRIKLMNVHVSQQKDGADPKSNALDTLLELLAKRSKYSNSGYPAAPGGRIQLDVRMLRSLLELSKYYLIVASEFAGGCHQTQAHYKGIAFDVTYLDNKQISESHPRVKEFEQDCRYLGAVKVYGPGQAGHTHHIHAQWAM